MSKETIHSEISREHKLELFLREVMENANGRTHYIEMVELKKRCNL